MNKMTYFVSNLSLATCLLLAACLAAAQNQQQPSPVLNTQPLPVISPVSTMSATPNTTVNCKEVTTKPTLETGKFSFESCIVLQFASYLTTGPGKYVELKNRVVDNSSSNCENATMTPKITIKFDCGSLSFSISRTNDSKTYVQAINGEYSLNSTKYEITNSTPTFNTTQPGHYYKCNAEQVINMKLLPNSSSLVNLSISNFALEAYRTAAGTEFYQIPEECPLDSQPVSDLVRIGVGVCLVALVAIVLIAYFIGRRRWSERSSYESV